MALSPHPPREEARRLSRNRGEVEEAHTVFSGHRQRSLIKHISQRGLRARQV